jgi:hypothetical protein
MQEYRRAEGTNYGHSTPTAPDCTFIVLVLAGDLPGQGGFAMSTRILGFREVAPATQATSHPSDAITAFGGSVMTYHCVATSVAGFVQQLAVGYLTNGYYFYVTGLIPPHKDPVNTDRKIMEAYDIAVSKWTRARRKREGQANIHYLRYQRFFIIIASHGFHRFFETEAQQLCDVRREPVLFMGYSIGYRRARGGGEYHASVRINRERFVELKKRFHGVAVHHTVGELCHDLRHLPFEPYAPVRVQLFGLLRGINRRRKLAGLELVPSSALRLHRSPVRPFEGAPESPEADVCLESLGPTEIVE